MYGLEYVDGSDFVQNLHFIKMSSIWSYSSCKVLFFFFVEVEDDIENDIFGFVEAKICVRLLFQGFFRIFIVSGLHATLLHLFLSYPKVASHLNYFTWGCHSLVKIRTA